MNLLMVTSNPFPEEGEYGHYLCPSFLGKWMSAGLQGQELGPEPKQAAAPLPFSSWEVEECGHGHHKPSYRKQDARRP